MANNKPRIIPDSNNVEHIRGNIDDLFRLINRLSDTVNASRPVQSLGVVVGGSSSRYHSDLLNLDFTSSGHTGFLGGSGTAEYLSKFTAPGTIGNSSIFFSTVGSIASLTIPVSQIFLGTASADPYTYGNSLNVGYNENAEVDFWVNLKSYHGGTTQNRNFVIGNGQSFTLPANRIAHFRGSDGFIGFNTDEPGCRLDIVGGVHVGTAKTSVDPGASNLVVDGTIQGTYKAADATAGATENVDVQLIGGGTRTLQFKNGLYVGKSDTAARLVYQDDWSKT